MFDFEEETEGLVGAEGGAARPSVAVAHKTPITRQGEIIAKQTSERNGVRLKMRGEGRNVLTVAAVALWICIRAKSRAEAAASDSRGSSERSTWKGCLKCRSRADLTSNVSPLCFA